MNSEKIPSLKDIVKTCDPADGVLVLVIKKNGVPEIFVPQLGLLTEARLEKVLPTVYRAIVVRRGQEQRMIRNERKTGTEVGNTSIE